MRVVIDTNVLVSGLAYPAGTPGRIVAAWQRGELELVLSRHLLAELARVLPRLNHRLNWSDADLLDFLDVLALRADVVEPGEVSAGTARDTDDLPVLGTLLAAPARYMITGDRDFLALADRYPIASPAQFWERHGEDWPK